MPQKKEVKTMNNMSDFPFHGTVSKELAAQQAFIDRQDALALERWGSDDTAMLTESKELIEFLDDGNRDIVTEWVKNYKQLPNDCHVGSPVFSNTTAQLQQLFSRPASQLNILMIKRETAEVLSCFLDRRSSFIDRWDGGLSHYTPGASDYEAWRAWCKQVHTSITPAFS